MLEKQRAKSKKDMLSLRVNFISSNLDKVKQELQESDVNKKLDSLEQKLKSINANIFNLNESIIVKEREGDFESVRNNVLLTCQQINSLLVQTNS